MMSEGRQFYSHSVADRIRGSMSGAATAWQIGWTSHKASALAYLNQLIEQKFLWSLHAKMLSKYSS